MMRESPNQRLWVWTNERPDTVKWVGRIKTLEGEFGRPPGFTRAAFGMMAVWTVLTGAMVLFLVRTIPSVPHIPGAGGIIGIFCVGFVIWAATVARRVGFRYELRGGTLTALGSGSNVMWRESLDHLQSIQYSRWRGAVRLKLIWPDHEREMQGIPSLLHALDDPA
jgi:hypothetical protein